MNSFNPSGHSFSWRDLAHTFHEPLELHLGRARFLSYGIENLDMRLRLFLWRFLVPHPSLSFVWLFSFA